MDKNSTNIEDFFDQTHNIYDRAKELYRRAVAAPVSLSELLPDTLEELQTVIEELKVAEEELRQQNEELILARYEIELEQQRYRELFNFVPDGYVVTDEQGIIKAANVIAAQLLNMSQAGLQGKPLAAFVDLADRTSFRQRLLRLSQEQSTQDWDIQIQPRNRATFDASIKAMLRTDVCNSRSLHWLFRDITAQRRAEQQIRAMNTELMHRVVLDSALREISERLQAQTDEAPIGRIVSQELVHLLSLVACDVRIFDHGAETATVVATAASVAPERSPSQLQTINMGDFAEGYRQLLDGQELQFCELTDHANRSQLSICVCPIIDHETVLGDIWCFMPSGATLLPNQFYLVKQVASQCAIAFRRSQIRRESEMQLAELRRINQLKDSFLSTVSHELRTPLTNMKMALHLLKIAKTQEQRDRCIQILQTECDQETALITDLLELQQLEAEQYPNFLPESIVVSEWLSIILAPFHERFAERQQSFAIDQPHIVPTLITDRASLRRVLIELVQNAHKHTAKGGRIELNVIYDPESESFTFRLSNESQIPVADLPHLFEKFHRVMLDRTWDTSGTGLGLALVSRLVEHLQGTITVSSEDSWTTFAVTIPNRLLPRSRRTTGR